MIILEPCAGLGNRLLAIASANKLCKELKQELVIIWKKEGGCNASAKDLFYFDDVKVIEISENGYRKELFATLKGNFIKRKYRKLANAFVPCEKIDEKKACGQFDALKAEIADFPVVYIKSFTNMCEIGKKDFLFIHPSANITNKGQKVFERINENTVGVHIRRTDHVEAIANSPLELFFDKMQLEIEKRDANFYVTTDDRTVEKALRDHFPAEKLIFYENKVIDRDSKEGIEDAMIDMLCLSKSCKILGSFNSTFSLIPSIMGGIPLEIVTKLSLV